MNRKAMYNFHLFEALGVELEYMIVDKTTLKVQPVSDKLLFDFSGNYEGDVENGEIDWSNELVAHVIELKSHEPTRLSADLANHFHSNIRVINRHLEPLNLALLPTAMHPFFNPLTETVLWQHDHRDIYELYDRIFDCNRHGWSNLQSVHLNLPFFDDKEFGNLHAAIRLLLPLIPGIAASSPVVEGKQSRFRDARMWYYIGNQQKVPSLIGSFIPEPVYAEQEYTKVIFDPIIDDFISLDPKGIMNHQFLNSRGAIARFDRKTIEIRVTDIQECPKADMAIAELIVGSLKEIALSGNYDLEKMKYFPTARLYDLFLKVIREGENTWIDDSEFLSLFNYNGKAVFVGDFWKFMFQKISAIDQALQDNIEHLLGMGTLSSRILKRIGDGEAIADIYHRLMKCLDENEWFA